MFEELEKINARPEPFGFYKVVLDKYTLVEPARIRTVYNWLQYFSPEALEWELGACGFSVEKFYANVTGLTFNPDSTEFAVIARKL